MKSKSEIMVAEALKKLGIKYEHFTAPKNTADFIVHKPDGTTEELNVDNVYGYWAKASSYDWEKHERRWWHVHRKLPRRVSRKPVGIHRQGWHRYRLLSGKIKWGIITTS